MHINQCLIHSPCIINTSYYYYHLYYYNNYCHYYYYFFYYYYWKATDRILEEKFQQWYQ